LQGPINLTPTLLKNNKANPLSFEYFSGNLKNGWNGLIFGTFVFGIGVVYNSGWEKRKLTRKTEKIGCDRTK
jgi:uncharacterized membrane protein YedE/YeeE